MFLSARRLLLIGVIAAVVAVIVLLPVILETLSGQGITNVRISLSKVQVIPNESNKTASLQVIFALFNPTDKALTTSRIDYELSANDTLLGNGTVSYEDIPLNGRPQLYPEKTIFIPSTFLVDQSKVTFKLYEKLTESKSGEHTTWLVKGVAQIDSAFTTLPKQFEASIPQN
jgi:hypothetical protein